MNKTTKIFLLVLVAAVVLIGVSAFSSYNGLATAKESVSSAYANIQTQLQRRTDLIPNLVSTVKGISAHEQDVVDSVTQARAALMGAKTIPEQAQANDVLSGALSRLMVLVENYPQIQSAPAYVALMDELAGTENRIATARVDYNDVVARYNQKTIRLPARFFAGMLGFDKAEYFEAQQGAEQVPQVSFE